jgi:GTPase SAR1 family protein
MPQQMSPDGVHELIRRAAQERARVLDLSNRSISQLPESIADLKELRSLNLSRNQLTRLPSSIGRLRKLVQLDISQNRIEELPQIIGDLTSLRELSLWANRIARVPDDIGKLRNLVFLTLNRNRLTSLPASIGNLTALRVLGLSRNQLTEVPASLARISSLRLLDLRKNQLHTLASAFGDLRGEDLRLEDNPWDEPIRSLVPSGAQCVIGYLRSLPTTEMVPGQATVPLCDSGLRTYEAKLMLVGDSQAGKTSLIFGLRGEAFLANRLSTHGVEVGELTLPYPDRDEQLRINTWDFGGHEVCQCVNQLFFSHRSLYLLVWKPHVGQEPTPLLTAWLQRILLRVPDARVLIIATHCDDGRHPPIDYASLESHFPGNLAGSFAVGNMTGRGIDELREAIRREVAKLPQMGEPLARSWIQLRDELSEYTQPRIYRSDFEQIATRVGLPADQQEALLAFLASIGRVVYFRDTQELRNVLVLRPEWLAQTLSHLLEDAAVREEAGLLTMAQLRQIWRNAQRPGASEETGQAHEFLVQLMERYDIGYRLPSDRILIPQFVRNERPTLPWEPADLPSPGETEIALDCDLTTEPPGLIACLTVRLYRFSTGRHWRRGLFLAESGSTALLELNGNRFTVRVRGSYPTPFFHTVFTYIQALLQERWPRLEPKYRIPCPNLDDRGMPCAGGFPYDGLQKIVAERSFDNVPCFVCGRSQNVYKLLSGIASTVHSPAIDQAQFFYIWYTILNAIGSESRECPGLFAIYPDPAGKTKRGMRQFLLQLYCECPGSAHPEGEPYHLEFAEEWLRKIAPYATFAMRSLKLVLSVAWPALAAADQLLTGADRADKGVESLHNGLTFFEKLAGQVLPQEPLKSAMDSTVRDLTKAEGVALRELREVLKAKDPKRYFAGLKSIPTPKGEFIWLCPQHYSQRNPARNFFELLERPGGPALALPAIGAGRN